MVPHPIDCDEGDAAGILNVRLQPAYDTAEQTRYVLVNIQSVKTLSYILPSSFKRLYLF